MKNPETGLTDKEQSLADAYVKLGYSDLKAFEASKYSQACKRNSKRITAYRVLHRPHVLAYIKQLKAKIAEKQDILADVTRQEVIENARWLVKYGKRNNHNTSVAQGNEQLGKIASVFTENLNTADTTKQRELAEKEALAADELAAELNRQKLRMA